MRLNVCHSMWASLFLITHLIPHSPSLSLSFLLAANRIAVIFSYFHFDDAIDMKLQAKTASAGCEKPVDSVKRVLMDSNMFTHKRTHTDRHTQYNGRPRIVLTNDT